MKDKAFGFSGDCHDPGVAGWLGLPFPLASVISAEAEIQVRVFHTDGYPPTPAGMTENLVKPDIGYRASILRAFRMDPRLPLRV